MTPEKKAYSAEPTPPRDSANKRWALDDWNQPPPDYTTYIGKHLRMCVVCHDINTRKREQPKTYTCMACTKAKAKGAA